MKHRHIAFGVVGVLVGFVLGFFVARTVDQKPAPVPQQVAATSPGPASTELPEGHPSPEVMTQIRQMQEEAANHPEDPKIRIALGNTFYDMGRFDAAIDLYEEALALDPGNVNVNTDLGTAYFYAGQGEKAIAIFQRSLQLEENHPQTLQNLGWVQFVSNNYQAAIESWEKLLRVHPEYENIEAVKEQLEKAKQHVRGEHS